MSGVLTSLAGIAGGALSITLTVGSSDTGGKVPTYYDGYTSASSQAGANVGALGAISISSYRGVAIRGIYWVSVANHTSPGTCYIEFAGNISAGFFRDVSVSGTSLGTIGSPNYNSSAGTTQFQLGTTTATNPFGVSGTKTVVLR